MIGTAAVFVGCLAYFALFRHYGFQVEDEGTLLFQLSRVAAGQAPYADFHTGYTPGFFFVGSQLLRSVDFAVHDLRLVLAVINAASAAALYWLARVRVGSWLALLPPLAWVTFIPAYRGDFAAFNVPYPAWFATLAWMGVAVAQTRWARTAGLLWLVAAGAFAAAAFAVKPNAGVFAAAASVWIISLTTRHPSPAERLVSALATVTLAVGVWVGFGLSWRTTDAAIHLLPAAALVVAALSYRGRFAPVGAPGAIAALGALFLGFAPLTLLWTVPTLARLGLAGFLREVLFVGSDASSVYYLPHPPPEPYAIAVVTGMLGFAALGWWVGKRTIGTAPALIALLLGAALVVVAVATTALMPETFADSVLLQLENAAYWLAPLVHWGGIALLVRCARSRAAPGSRGAIVLVPLSVAMYMQLYPRTDFMHVAIAVPMTCVLGVMLLARCFVWWLRGQWPSWLRADATIGAVVAAAVVVVCGLKTVPLLASAAACLRSNDRVVRLDRLMLCLEPRAADDLRAFGRAADYLDRHTEPGEPVLAFPAATGLLYAAALSSPVEHDYWYPGYPGHDAEERMLERLERKPPRFVVTVNSGWTFFIESPPYFSAARAFVTGRYRLAARFGRFDILARADVSESAVVVEDGRPAGPMEAAIEPVLAYRRQAARRWMEGLLPEATASAILPTDPRDAVLLLRALRDGGDLRAASWILQAYRSRDPRVSRDAVSAMEQVAKGLLAARDRWANDFDPGAYQRCVESVRTEVPALLRSEDRSVRAFAEALVFVLDSGGAPGRAAAHSS